MFNLRVTLLLFLGCIVSLTSCVYYPSERASKIRESDSAFLKQCKLVGQVYGEHKLAPFTSMAVEIAKDQAKLQAARMGATDVSWEEINNRGAAYALGRAYICTK